MYSGLLRWGILLTGLVIQSFIFRHLILINRGPVVQQTILWYWAMVIVAFLIGVSTTVDFANLRRLTGSVVYKILKSLVLPIIIGFGLLYLKSASGVARFGVNPFGLGTIMMNNWTAPVIAVGLGALVGSSLKLTER